MRPLALLLLATVLGHSAPLPPFPGVTRPPVLPTFRPASVALATIGMSLTENFNFFRCPTNAPDCLLYDVLDATAAQHAGMGTVIEFCDALGAPWVELANFGAGPGEYTVGFTWLYESRQRPVARFLRARVVPTAFVPAGFRPSWKINPAIKGTILPRIASH